MSQDPSQAFQLRWQTVKPWLTTIAIIWLLGFVGLGWLVKSFLVLIGLLTITPVVAVIGIQWWLRRNLIQGSCPVCQFQLTTIGQSPTQCPNCGEKLTVDNGTFHRMEMLGTIDVQAVEVPAQVVTDDD